MVGTVSINYQILNNPQITHIQELRVNNRLKCEKIQLLHRKLGNISQTKIHTILGIVPIYGLKPRDVKLFQVCEA